MILLVCGGRDFTDRDAAFSALDRAHAKRPVTVLIHGVQRGADTLAGEWAEARGIKAIAVKALWEVHGPAAWPLRNQAMLEMGPEGAVALPGGRGTADMVRRCRSAGVLVWEPYRGAGA